MHFQNQILKLFLIKILKQEIIASALKMKKRSFFLKLKKIHDFKNNLMIPNGKDSIDSLFYLFYMLRYLL